MGYHTRRKRMKKTVTFEATSVGQRRFAYLYDSVILGGSKGQIQGKDDLRAEAAIQIKLEAISEPTPKEQIDPRYRPETARSLKAEGGSLDLTVSEIERIEKLIGAVPWGGAQKVAVADLYDFLSAAPVAEPVN